MTNLVILFCKHSSVLCLGLKNLGANVLWLDVQVGFFVFLLFLKRHGIISEVSECLFGKFLTEHCSETYHKNKLCTFIYAKQPLNGILILHVKTADACGYLTVRLITSVYQ